MIFRKWLKYYNLHNANFNLSGYCDSGKTTMFPPVPLPQWPDTRHREGSSTASLSPHLSKFSTTRWTCTNLTRDSPVVIPWTSLTSPPRLQDNNPQLPFYKELTWQMFASFSVWSSGARCMLTTGWFPNHDRTAFTDLSCSYTCPELCKTRQWVYRKGKRKSSCKKHGLHSLFAWHEVLEAGTELSLPWQFPQS